MFDFEELLGCFAKNGYKSERDETRYRKHRNAEREREKERMIDALPSEVKFLDINQDTITVATKARRFHIL